MWDTSMKWNSKQLETKQILVHMITVTKERIVGIQTCSNQIFLRKNR